jgi:hypothetical protein
MFKNVKIIVLYQNIGGHKTSCKSFGRKKRVWGGVGEGFSVVTLIILFCVLLFNIINIIGWLLLPYRPEANAKMIDQE